ncbi:MAG: permease-like cell division protein FtsX [Bacteroidales bacterium]|nr:permease-like cell division protein FtsX [Bacteroidales bacterium]
MSKHPEALDKITKARLKFSAFGSICSIALTMFFVGTLAVLAVYSTRYLNHISQNLELEVLFFDATPQQVTAHIGDSAVMNTVNQPVQEADIVNYELRLKNEPFVATSRVSSRAENTTTTKQLLRNDFDKYIDNPINASIILTLKPEYTHADSLLKIKQFIQQNEQVREVVYSDVAAQFIQQNLRKTQWIILGICGVFLFISLLLISNSLRLNIYSKRFNIRSLLLIGATRAFVRRPFVLKGLTQGIIGGFLATVGVGVILYGGYVFTKGTFIDLSEPILPAAILAGVFLFSILFTTLTAFVYTNKYIKVNPDRLYL